MSTRDGKNRAPCLTVQMVMEKLLLNEESLDGGLELEIPWDPLALSRPVMENCQKRLNQVAPFNGSVQCEQKELISPFKEPFQKSSIYSHGRSFLIIGITKTLFLIHRTPGTGLALSDSQKLL